MRLLSPMAVEPGVGQIIVISAKQDTTQRVARGIDDSRGPLLRRGGVSVTSQGCAEQSRHGGPAWA